MTEIYDIKLINGVIYATCYPEGNKDECFYLEIDIHTHKCKMTPEEPSFFHAQHSYAKLLTLYESGKELPKQCVVMSY